MTFETPIERARRLAKCAPTRPPMTLTETDKPEWQHLWESQHPESYWCSERRRIIEDIVDFLLTNEGYLDICATVVEGRLYVTITAPDTRTVSWSILDGLLPTECDRIRDCLRANDHENREVWVTEGLIHAALTTVLHLGSVAEPVAMVNGMRQRYSLVAWLDGLRAEPPTVGSDAWDALAQQVEFDAEFPPAGPSGKRILSLLASGCSWPLPLT
ncbi:MAG: hypothetical protein ACLQNE_26280 [Thermoguttaceae bacterium]